MANDCEMACDADALGAIKNRSRFVTVIETLQVCPSAAVAVKGAAFGASDARPRIEALSAGESAYRHPATAYLLLAVIWFSQVGAVTGITHWVVESIAALGT